MENRGILRRPGWVSAGKGLVAGAIAGAVVTTALLLFVWYAPGREYEFFAALVGVAVTAPAAITYEVLGWEWRLPSSHEDVLRIIPATLVVNTVLCALLGGLLGQVLYRFRTSKNARGS